MLQYLPIENEVFSPSLGWYRAFGLRVLRTWEAGEMELMVLPAVSSDFGFTLRLASLLTEKQLDPLCLLALLENLY